MTQTQNPAAIALVLRRTFDAPRETVFKAWTDPAIMRQFFDPTERGCKGIEVDLRTGGAYRIAMVGSDGSDFVAVGTYREVVVPERVVCTWRWLEDDPSQEHDTLLTLEFIARGQQTELVLTHENLRDAESCANHTEGWTKIIDACEKILA
ncbi:MAG TPA: SRPBCC domain-containing protein [Candidatus Baltobacteraceae bacterium]|nr:SRPBCC domain-containing protein [Candidatus Baltobacteraceae bacterium]